MSNSPENSNDAELLAQLREAFGFDEPSSPETIEMIMTGFDIVNIDVLLAELVHDSDIHDAPVPIRGGDAGARIVSFAGEGVRFDFEIGDTAPHIVGRVTPGTSGSIALDQVGNRQERRLDESGTFEFTITSGAPYRLRLIPERARSIATEWLISSPEA